MKRLIKSVTEHGHGCLSTMILLALITSTAWGILQSQCDPSNQDWRLHPEWTITGMRYYLRRHRRTGSTLINHHVANTAVSIGQADHFRRV